MYGLRGKHGWDLYCLLAGAWEHSALGAAKLPTVQLDFSATKNGTFALIPETFPHVCCLADS